MRRAYLICLLLVLAIAGAYWQVNRAEFLNFDDGQYVTNNPKVFHGLTRSGFAWAWTTTHAANWHPLTWLSHMLDCQLFGDRAAGHHWVNVGFHAANAVLLFLFLWRATGALGRSGFVAALFALHPLHVESVAWISERKDVLSTFFFLLTLCAYFRFVAVSELLTRGSYVRRNSPSPQPSPPGRGSTVWCFGLNFSLGAIPRLDSFVRRAQDVWVSYLPSSIFYVLSLFCFALGLMSKAMLVTLPFALLLLDFWPLRRFDPGASAAKLSLAWKLCLEKAPFLLLSAASAAITIYAQKGAGAVAATDRIPVAVRLLNACLAYVWYLEKAFWPVDLGPYYAYPAELLLWPALRAGLVLLVLSAAVLFLARRAPYLLFGWLWYLGTLVPVIGLVQVGNQAMADRYSYVPLLGIFVAVTWSIAEALAPRRYGKAVLAGVGASILAGCFIATSFQLTYWKDSISLFSRALTVCPEQNFLAQHNLGHALSMSGNQREAMEHFREALRIAPKYTVAHFNWGNSLGVQGKTAEAIVHYREAIRLEPTYEQAYYHLGKALALAGDLEGARSNLLLALRYKPDYGEAMVRLGNLLVLQRVEPEGMRWLSQAVTAEPDEPEAWYYLGAALARQGRRPEAVQRFRQALKLQPRLVLALNDLAWVLATESDPKIRDVSESIRLGRTACQETHFDNPMYLDTLAVALSEGGQFAEAVAQTRRAIEIAQAQHEPNLVRELENHLARYLEKRPYTAKAATER
jgi:protein O-mannosyl-transferase